ncbi:MAG TPA: Zn-ribbon domain-containing OB-fold protein, partial [Candidatus Hydrogenedentes bacterium]|nr:Zn-ribbon domain-containing OB-fold protein [Candidatus Hydrogenedentota bacterium]
EEKECAFVIEGKMALPYQYYAGAIGSQFIVALRDDKRILGVRCEKCRKTFVPPRQSCERCFSSLTDHWVEVGSSGVLTGFTVIRYAEPYQPKEPPYVLALIKLDGADTPIAHILECGDARNARIGMRVRAVFSEKPRDTILAISHFEEE